MDPRYHTGIQIWVWERGLTYPHMEMVNHRFHMGIEKSGSSFPYGDHRMETGIDPSPFPYGDYPVPNPFP
jgi:hypothetical protein